MIKPGEIHICPNCGALAQGKSSTPYYCGGSSEKPHPREEFKRIGFYAGGAEAPEK